MITELPSFRILPGWSEAYQYWWGSLEESKIGVEQNVEFKRHIKTGMLFEILICLIYLLHITYEFRNYCEPKGITECYKTCPDKNKEHGCFNDNF